MTSTTSSTLFLKTPTAFRAASFIAEARKNGQPLDFIWRFYDEALKNEKPNVPLLSSLLNVCRESNRPDKALLLWRDMQKFNIEPNKFSFDYLIYACHLVKDSKTAAELVNKILEEGIHHLQINSVQCAMLINLIAEERFEDVVRLFHYAIKQSIELQPGAYIALFNACKTEEHFPFVREIENSFYKSNASTVAKAQTALLNAYARCCETIEDIEILFRQLVKSPTITRNDIVYYTTIMLNAYGRHKCIREAEQLFANYRQFATIPMWKALLSVYATNGRIESAERIIKEMRDPDNQSYTTMIAAYAEAGDIPKMLQALHLSGNPPDCAAWTTAIIGYGKMMNKPQEAFDILRQMESKGVAPDRVTWISLITSCSEDLSLGKKIHHHYLTSQSSKNIDVPVYNALISFYSKFGEVDTCQQLFDQIPVKSRSVVSWTALMTAYSRKGESDKAMDLFHQMKKSNPEMINSTFVWSTLFSACSNVGAIQIGRQLHQELINRKIVVNSAIVSSLIAMYANCGSLNDAKSVFADILPSQHHTLRDWNAMMSALGQHGCAQEAIDLFKDMTERHHIRPDAITFTILLNACSHTGKLEESLHFLNIMQDQYHITPANSHYTAVVDALGRAGRLDEAETMVKERIPSYLIAWKALLGACRIHGDIERAERAAAAAIKLNPVDASIYVQLSNVYSSAKRWDDSSRVRKEMEKLKITKIPGRSWIDVDGEIHSFLVRDQSHPRTKEIYAELDTLDKEMKEAGFVPDTAWVLQDIPEDEKEEALCAHSEKLALAFGLLSTAPDKPITIIKNLRVCGNCHASLKLISKLRKRELFVRDASRYHHFSNGHCSCGDYF